MSAHHLFEPPKHIAAEALFDPQRHNFAESFAHDLLTEGECRGHQLEDLLDPSAFPQLKTAIAELATANDPMTFTEASISIRKCIREAAHTLGQGVFDQLMLGVSPGGIDHGLRS